MYPPPPHPPAIAGSAAGRGVQAPRRRSLRAGITSLFMCLTRQYFFDVPVSRLLVCFSFGASSLLALFTQLGGGIYTKTP
ncbi:hypothetical protein AB1Y20_016833 [Prymnesium parvum]|uniref:Uncharacterized protein n=1 Tax=Prymnesium parvum TaxID=97485 RepID=A0AB34IAW3_PRYPA